MMSTKQNEHKMRLIQSLRRTASYENPY